VGLCFALNISAFAIPAWIGAPERAYPLTYKIYQAIQLGGMDGITDATSFALVLFIFSLIPFLWGFKLQKEEKKYILVSGKSSRSRNENASTKTQIVFQAAFFISQVFFWFSPIATLFISTIVKPGCLQDEGIKCLEHANLSSYKYVIFDLKESQFGLKNSLIYGTISAFLISFIALASLSLLAKRKKSLKVLESLFTIPLATPGAIIALGLIVVASGQFKLNLYNTPWIVVAAFVVKHLSLSFSPLVTGYSNISGSLLEAAKLSGASTTSIWKRILIPMLKPEILGGVFLVLVPILGELTMSVFLSSPSFRSIGTVLFDLQDYADQGSAGSLAFLLVLLILILNELSRILSRGRLGY
jgi:iron(III) transport system permease protein